MGKSYNWHRLLERSWFYTKVFFAVLALCVAAYIYGTYNPNTSAKAVVNEELDKFYMKKIEEMGLQEPEFTYNNDIQFIRAMHKCINYINLKREGERFGVYIYRNLLGLSFLCLCLVRYMYL